MGQFGAQTNTHTVGLFLASGLLGICLIVKGLREASGIEFFAVLIFTAIAVLIFLLWRITAAANKTFGSRFAPLE